VNPNSPFDLHWRLFGIDFRVRPGFWLINLLFGYFYVSIFKGVGTHLVAYLGMWVACAFVSIMIHELGHVITGRLFGAHSNIILQAMGGAAVGDFPRLKVWQRILVIAAGPAFGLALFAFLDYAMPSLIKSFDSVNNSQIASNRWYQVLVNPMAVPFLDEGPGNGGAPGMLLIMNLIWNVFNLIPIIPLDGGMLMREIVCVIIPRFGLRLAYGFSFLLAGSVTAYSIIKYMRPNIPYLLEPLDPLFTAIMFGLMAYGSLVGLIAAGARPESPPDEAPVVRGRATGYEEKDW
jgi:stage IV sporulation protein FB